MILLVPVQYHYVFNGVQAYIVYATHSVVRHCTFVPGRPSTTRQLTATTTVCTLSWTHAVTSTSQTDRAVRRYTTPQPPTQMPSTYGVNTSTTQYRDWILYRDFHGDILLLLSPHNNMGMLLSVCMSNHPMEILHTWQGHLSKIDAC